MKTVPNKNQIYTPFLSLASISFILGIIFANYFKFNFIIFYIINLFILALSYFLKRNPISNVLIVLIFFFVGLLHEANFKTMRTDDIFHLSKNNFYRVKIKGIVASEIQEGPFDKSFEFNAENIKAADCSTKVSGKVLVRFNKNIKFNYGDKLTVEGKLQPLKDEGYFNKKLIQKGIRSTLNVRYKDWIEIEEAGKASLKRLAFGARDRLKQRFKFINSPTREFLIAFILGERSKIPEELYSIFKYTGTVHILAISGFNVGIIIFIFLVFLKILRLRQKSRFIITILFLIFYCFMTGLSPSVVRAVIMGITFILSFMIRKEYQIYNSLALAAIIILGFWPWQIFDIGFQLSFISVFCIVFFSKKIMPFLPKTKSRLFEFIKLSLVVSLSAWVGTTILVAYYFGMVSFVAIIANIFVVPLTSFIITGGFLYLVASFTFNLLAKWIALSLEFMIGVLIYLTVLFKDIPFAYFYVEKFSIYLVLAYYIAIIFLFRFPAITAFSRRKHNQALY